MNRRDRLHRLYREHHRSFRTPDFVFGGRPRFELFRTLVGGPGLRVLDVGCRYGALTRAYIAGNNVTGMDIDRDALDAAAGLGITTRWGDVNDGLPFTEDSFDVVVCGELLEHLPHPQHLIAECHRVLRCDGTLVGSVPNAYRLVNRLRFLLGRPPEQDPTHLHMFSPAEVRTLLQPFTDLRLFFLAGRFVFLSPRLFANDIAFAARKPCP